MLRTRTPQDRGPVVVVVSDSSGRVTALRRAAGEVATHSVYLHVVDGCSSEQLRESLLGQSDYTTDRRRRYALSILRDPNVTISKVDAADLNNLVARCKKVSASLLVIGNGFLRDTSQLGSPLGSLADEIGPVCDLLTVRHELDVTS